MRRLGKILIWALTCAFLCAQGFAMSEEATPPPLRRLLNVSLTAQPDSLVAPGEVTLQFQLTNTSEYDAENVSFSLADGAQGESLGRVAAGASQTFTRKYSVSQEELDAGLLSFRVTHDDPSGDGSVVEYPVECALSRSQSAPALEFTRQVPARSVTSGADVLLIYRVRNTGNVPLTDIRVQDGEFDRRLDRLDCGESHAFVNRITVSQSTRSSARVSCVAQDGENTSLQQQLEEITLQPVSPSLEVTLTLDKQTGPVGGTVNGVVTLAAAGGDVTDISLWDAVNGTLMADALELHEGESVTLTCAWPIRESAAYRVRARGYAADGSVLVGVSGEVERGLSGEFSEIALDISAAALTPVISRSGYARVEIALENTGNTDARDVVLSERSQGEVYRFAFVPTGETTYKDCLVPVEADGEFAISEAYTDAQGNLRTAEAAPVSIQIDKSGAEPESVSSLYGLDSEAPVQEISGDGAYLWMIALGGGVLVVLIIILVVSHDRDRRNWKMQKIRRKKNSAKRGATPAAKRGGNDV